ncbi:MAG: hypothetical protein IM534_02350 [Chitinophagaceae bacterium]|nr:hypothetical protein [Chitinophagaceae bacterium]
MSRPILRRELATIPARLSQPENSETNVATPKTSPDEKPIKRGLGLFFSLSPQASQYSINFRSSWFIAAQK